MRPSRFFLILLLILFGMGVAVVFVAPLVGGFLCLAVAVAVAALLDFLIGFRKRPLQFQRDYPSRCALGSTTKVQSRIINPSKLAITLRYFDGLPSHCEFNGFPFKQKIGGEKNAEFEYHLTFLRRGDQQIEPAFLELRSPFGFWWRSRRLGNSSTVKVYPDYKPAMEHGLLATSDRLEQMGIVKKRFRGMSKEFHQLRDYQDGDPINQIDWKASSRINRLISREFQEERDQNILLVADCSIRTRAVDRDLPILDHLLNAMILIAYMATKQGDKISITNFGVAENEQRYLAPVKGATAMSQVIDHLYNYKSTESYGEYTDLAKRILSYPMKRSLIIVLTNLRTEDQYGCAEALSLLSQQHMVLLASVQETSVSSILSSPIYDVEDANRYLGATAYEQDAEQIVSDLAKQNINVLRSPIETYGIALANHYLDLRGSISA